MDQKRKDQLYDEMIDWICENINNDEDLYITLHDHFGMTKEELHEHCIDSLDKFFEEGQEPNKRDMLIEKIDEEYKKFLEDLESYDVDNIITGAEYIATLKTVHEFIHKGYIIKDDQIDYFLGIKKPLDAISDWYNPNEIEIINDLDQAISEIIDQGLYMDEDPEEDISNGGMEMS